MRPPNYEVVPVPRVFRHAGMDVNLRAGNLGCRVAAGDGAGFLDTSCGSLSRSTRSSRIIVLYDIFANSSRLVFDVLFSSRGRV